MGDLTYLISFHIVIVPIILALLILCRGTIRKYSKLILCSVALGVIYAFSEYFAVKWNIWTYFENKSLFSIYGVQVETILLNVYVFLTLCLLFIYYNEKVKTD